MSLNWLKGCGLGALSLALAMLLAPSAFAQATSSGYPEKVIRWKVEGGESCADISEAVYGSARHQNLVQRYNEVPCAAGTPLSSGQVLVLPQGVTKLPAATVTYVNPDTESRPAGGSWAEAKTGQNLKQLSEVNTHEAGMAGIQFADATRIFLNEHTLVVVYDTAGASAPLSTPPKVHLKSGEISAGLSALSGRSVKVQLPDDATVTAASQDTVVRRDQRKVNVSVFDGSAEVKSAGQSVKVPKNYGSRVIHRKAPEKPRPLPPAPLWDAPFQSILFAEGGSGNLSASWSAVPEAKEYRVEISRTPDFQDLVVRETVPTDIRRLRAENFPAGEYYIRARAIDTEDFLGISSEVRRVLLVPFEWRTGAGNLDTEGLSTNRYSTLSLGSSESVQVSLGDGPAHALPLDLDWSRLAAESLRLSDSESGSALTLPIEISPWDASLEFNKLDDSVRLDGTFATEGIDVKSDLRPRLTVSDKDGEVVLQRSVAESDGAFEYVLPQVEDSSLPLSAELRDGTGQLLASAQLNRTKEKPPKASASELSWPKFQGGWVRGASSRLSRGVFSPRMPQRAEVRARVDGVSTPATGSADARATGAWERVSFEGDFDLFHAPNASSSGGQVQGGLGYLTTSRHAPVSVTPALRLLVPLDGIAPSTRGELLIALGQAQESFSWVANLGARVAFAPDSNDGADDWASGHFLFSANYQLHRLFLLSGQLDMHLLARSSASSLLRGGLGLSATVGQRFFSTLGARVAPWSDVGEGHLSGQLSLGVRIP